MLKTSTSTSIYQSFRVYIMMFCSSQCTPTYYSKPKLRRISSTFHFFNVFYYQPSMNVFLATTQKSQGSIAKDPFWHLWVEESAFHFEATISQKGREGLWCIDL